jgi:nucleoside-diphosphate-sugar epimerase
LAEPAAWITEEVMPLPKNIYGITKLAAENLCYNTHRKHKLPCIILRTSRFFPEDDDDATKRAAFTSNNLKTNEYLFRRVDIEDAVNAHLCAARHADSIGLGTYIVSATSPFMPEDLLDLRLNAPLVVHKYAPEYQDIYNIEGWRMSDSIDRVYINKKAMAELGWNPVFDFKKILAQVKQGAGIVSPLGAMIGSKGYHQVKFDEGPYPIDNSTFRQAC